MKHLGILALVLFIGIATISPAHASLTTVNFPEIAISESYPYPTAPIPWSTQSFTIPTGETITSAIFSGTWGQSSVFTGSTADAQLFVNNVLVSDTRTLNPNPYYNVVPFTYTYSDFSSLLSGVATLSFTQIDGDAVVLSGTTLTITSEPAPTPIPAAVWLLGSGLMGLVGIRKRKSFV